MRHLGCDCRKPVTVVDPCFTPWGCACYCVRLRGLLDDCPRLHPQRTGHQIGEIPQ